MYELSKNLFEGLISYYSLCDNLASIQTGKDGIDLMEKCQIHATTIEYNDFLGSRLF